MTTSLARFCISLAAVAALTANAALADGEKPIRQLTYKFDITLSTDATIHDSGIGGGPISGSSDYRGGTTDEGTISVDVMQVQPDQGLVVQIAEQARNRRDATPTMCVIYGTGMNICDQSHGQLNAEEMTLLRFLGRNFVNRSEIDAKNHWRYSTNTPQADETNDYTIANSRGETLDINYQRVLKVSGAGGFDATTDGSLTYNEKLSVPLSIKEQTTSRKNTGMGNYTTSRQDLSFTLNQDSMQQAAQVH
jgi:hypothetical protein